MQIYSEKKHLNGPGGVTWSHEEYGHPGFQKVMFLINYFDYFNYRKYFDHDCLKVRDQFASRNLAGI